MIRRNVVPNIMLIASMLCPATATHASPTHSTYKDELRSGVEEIYVFRTIRTQHQSGKTPACAAAPFASANEDYYDLWSIALNAGDGRISNTHRSNVGGFTACLGQLALDHPLQMYAMGTVAHVHWTGVGECVALKSQPPVRTAIAFNCRLNLSGLPDIYSSGFMVSSTLAPFLGKNQEPSAHVPGYLSTSVVIVRLWKKPAAAKP
jgi:hypothetical protein